MAVQRPTSLNASGSIVDGRRTTRSGRLWRSNPAVEIESNRRSICGNEGPQLPKIGCLLPSARMAPARGPPRVGGHRCRGRSRIRSTAPAHPSLRVRPTPQLVATTVTVAAHPRATPGRLVPAPASLPARGHLSVGARAQVRRQARVAAHRRRKSTFDPHHQPDHNQVRAVEMAIRRRRDAARSASTPLCAGVAPSSGS